MQFLDQKVHALADFDALGDQALELVKVRVQAGAGAHLRRMADAPLDSSTPLDPFETGVIDVRAPNLMHLVAALCSAGEHAIVEGPPEIRADVITRLHAVARRHAGPR